MNEQATDHPERKASRDMRAAPVVFTLTVEDLHVVTPMTDAPASSDAWQFWIDRGGTFTGVVGRRAELPGVRRGLWRANRERIAARRMTRTRPTRTRSREFATLRPFVRGIPP